MPDDEGNVWTLVDLSPMNPELTDLVIQVRSVWKKKHLNSLNLVSEAVNKSTAAISEPTIPIYLFLRIN